MQKLVCCFMLLLPVCASLVAQNQLQSPAEFMPHKYGEQFTPHHLLVDYFEHVAANSDFVVLDEYGNTSEKRPLLYAIVTDPANYAQIENIRKDNLIRAGMLEGEISTNIPIVWLSYNVHGNEAGGSESALTTIYELATQNDPKVKEWLKKVVIIFDPCINPDGYSRYTHWNRMVSNQKLNPIPDSREHNEPWPGGRVNHYLFDLNRDWAWLTQVESQQRIKIFQEWVPQVHVDFHEMGHNEPYYFAPAAKPYHDYITDWQGEFQFKIGRNHASYFDKQGWTYFTREVFDLFYPSYGDTYPTFNGAIGMTYEQGGHSRAGQGILMNNGDTLRLQDRINHHHTTGMSTIEVSANNAEDLLNKFKNYFEKYEANPPGKYKSFFISQDNDANKLKKLIGLLDAHKIKYGTYSGSKSGGNGYDYTAMKEGTIRPKKGDLAISAYQAKAVLTQVLFEPNPSLEDSLTYDITAWALPYAFGLEAYASTDKINMTPGYSIDFSKNENKKEAYAAIIPWKSSQSARLLSQIYQAGIQARVASEAFTLNGKNHPPGTLIVLRADNKPRPEWANSIRKLADELTHSIHFESTGFADQGHDLGSSAMRLLKAPSVLVVGGEGVNPNSFGQVWHWMEKELTYPLSVADPKRLNRVDLDDFDVVIMPGGGYGLSEATRENLNDWMRNGGVLIAMSGALNNFADRDGFALKRVSAEDKDKPAMQDEYIGQDRKYITHQMPGAIFKTSVDNTHPLAYGLDKVYYSLKTSPAAYQLLKNGWNVSITDEEATHVGFGGAKAIEKSKNSLVFGQQSKGRGSIVYLIDNPLFRGFWEAGEFVMSNAVLIVGGQ